MRENFGIALRKQKKLILIFLLTIFLPALTLGIFGVQAIRNERFRLAKQEENDGRRAARFIKAQIQSRFEDIARILEGMARDPVFIGKDHASIRELAEKKFAADPLIGQAVLQYEKEEASFPLLLAPPEKEPAESSKAGEASLALKIRKAEALEFVDRNFRSAAAFYRELFRPDSSRKFQAEMLTGQARSLQKAGEYDEAVRIYARIAGEYFDCRTPSGLPLGLLAKLQTIECYERSGDLLEATRHALDAYGELLKKPSPLSEDQSKAYLLILGEKIDAVLAEEEGARVSEDYLKEYTNLKKLRADRMKEWEAVRLLRKEIVPGLSERLSQSGAYTSKPYRFSKTVEGRDLLFLAAWIPDRTGEETAGIVGVQINNNRLLESVLPEAVGGAQMEEGVEVILADLTGRPLSGRRNTSVVLPLATEYFDDNFPPWKIELFQTSVKGLDILDLRRNFYFWTILTLIVVLAFGAILIVRTIGREMEILKLKSDFVSSVSHEFKTPLTSIKALMERLIDGKVRAAEKMDQYFSIIAHDTEKLTRLVNNLLDFSKIEEGKKEYAFSETDIARIVAEQVQGFQKEQAAAGPDIHLEINGAIPTLRADPEALSRALSNLLSNAAKYTPPGKMIRVNLSSDTENVILEVEDEGIGIHPDDVGKVFEKFFQGRNALEQTVKGTGLGLTLVKHIVEAHGGRILVESRRGVGSKFSVVFPIKT